MAMTPEGRVKMAVKKLLKERHAWHFMPMQNGMGVVGIPDIIACYRGFFLAIETKAPKKTPSTPSQRWSRATPNQQHQIEGIIAAYGTAAVVDHVDQVRELLDHIDALASQLEPRGIDHG